MFLCGDGEFWPAGLEKYTTGLPFVVMGSISRCFCVVGGLFGPIVVCMRELLDELDRRVCEFFGG